MTIVLEGPIKTTTELSSETSAILESATTQPVTIKREKRKDSIVLLNRDVALQALAARSFIQQLVAILRYVVGDDDGGYPIEFEWLRQFDADEVREFALEFADAIQRVATDGAPMVAVDSVVQQWRKSAAVLRDAALRERLDQELQRADEQTRSASPVSNREMAVTT
jgi:hypothetical protein